MPVHYILEEDISSVTNSIQENVPIVISILTLCWIGVYTLVRKVLPEQSPEFCIRVVTLCHGLTTAYFGVSECLDGGLLGDPLPMTNNQSLLIAFSASYFVLDLIWCLLHQTETKLMLFHHLYSCIALMRILNKGYSASQSICGLGTTEVTNPLLQTRWFLRTLGYQHNPFYVILEFLFAFVFIFARVIFGTIFIIIVIFSTSNNIEYKFLSLLIYILSWLFLMNILNYMYNKYFHNGVSGDDDFKPTSS